MPGRKMRYDLAAVRKSNGLLLNMDSQAPNQAVKEYQYARNAPVTRFLFFQALCLIICAAQAAASVGQELDDRAEIE